MTTLTRSATDRLRNGFHGELISPGEDGYDAARQVWNGAIDRRPALVARASGTADVVRRCASRAIAACRSASAAAGPPRLGSRRLTVR